MPRQSPQMGNTGKYAPIRDGLILDLSVLPSSTGCIFSHIVQLRTLAWHLWEFTSGCIAKVYPLSALSIRTHQIWPSISLSAMCYESILNMIERSNHFKYIIIQSFFFRFNYTITTPGSLHAIFKELLYNILLGSYNKIIEYKQTK